MKLQCTIGSLSCDGVLAENGDVFEVSYDAGKSLLESGYATRISDVVVEDENVVGVKRYDGNVKPKDKRK